MTPRIGFFSAIKQELAFLLLRAAMHMLPKDCNMVDSLRWGFLLRNDRESYEAMCEMYAMKPQGFDAWAELWSKISAESPIRDAMAEARKAVLANEGPKCGA